MHLLHMDTVHQKTHSIQRQWLRSGMKSGASSGPLPKSDDVPIPALFAPSVAVTPVAVSRRPARPGKKKQLWQLPSGKLT
jgi:hypothetical protein